MASEGLSFRTSVVERAFAYWSSKRTAGGLPSRADLRPEEIPRLLPYVFLVDVERAPMSFRFRLVGTEICRLAAREHTGVRVNLEEYGSSWASVFRTYSRVVHSANPEVAMRHAPWKSREFLIYEYLIAPLSSTRGVVDMLFGALYPIAGDALEKSDWHRERL